jgi:hypothetical protein
LLCGNHGASYVAAQSEAMMCGAAALFAYGIVVCHLLMRGGWNALPATVAAALDAAGAVLGSLGMLGFALTFSLLVKRTAPMSFVAALATWAAISVTAWWVWRHRRATMAVVR